jgi:hypothetical protein
MGNSYVDYRNQGFCVNDSEILIWLSLALEEIEKIKYPAPCIVGLKEHWKEQLKLMPTGAITLYLDIFLENSDQEKQLLFIIEKLMRRLKLQSMSPKSEIDETNYAREIQTGTESTDTSVKISRCLRKMLQHDFPYKIEDDYFCSIQYRTFRECEECGTLLIGKNCICRHCQENENWLKKMYNKGLLP